MLAFRSRRRPSILAKSAVWPSIQSVSFIIWWEHEVFRPRASFARTWAASDRDRKSTRLNSSHLGISYAVFCLKKKKLFDVGQRAGDDRVRQGSGLHAQVPL